MKATTLTDDPVLTNIYGPLSAQIRRRLRDVLRDPRRYWDRDHGIMVRGGAHDPRWLTLWQAIMAVDPTFPKIGKLTDQAGRVIEDWPRYPDQVLIARALRYAAGERT